MAGTFLLTFDCEGKWGFVDRLGRWQRQSYTTAQEESAYRSVLALLKKYRIPATFAFTAAFSMSRRDFSRLQPEVRARGAADAPWMRRALSAIAEDDGDGWFAPACLQAVKDAPLREIASHGFSHIPWGEPYASRELLEAELALNRAVEGFGPDAVETFIYPRNQVEHTDLLPPHGFRIYRQARRSLGRPANLMRELNLLARSEQLGDTHRLPIAVPAGYFLNWRHGLRRCIPVSLTLARWRHILRHAERTDGVVHAWTHPEDFIGADSMFALLDHILRATADERENGTLRVLTCRELVRPRLTELQTGYPVASALTP
jgi:peptidoglycan/xylan/chitin deacetylase (PgdA/CDA1 family)